MEEKELALLSKEYLMSRIYTIRGVQVMLDVDLAALYGYETKNFNRQVNNNLNRFDNNFRFQLTDTEVEILRCNFCTSSWGGTRYRPYAFTEEGIYMLMTVLKGDLAAKQSKKLIMLFKQMKDYIIQRQYVLPAPELLTLSLQTQNNTEEIQQIKKQMVTHMTAISSLTMRHRTNIFIIVAVHLKTAANESPQFPKLRMLCSTRISSVIYKTILYYNCNKKVTFSYNISFRGGCIHRFGANPTRAATVLYDNACFYGHGTPDGIR